MGANGWFLCGELALLLAWMLLAAWRPRAGARALSAVLRRVDRLAARPAAAILVCAGSALAGSALVSWLGGWPLPRVHDEFSNLLAGDTFAHGRLANPTPPAWEHFETFHVLLTPVYASKYPPGQGLSLALGQRLGHPLLGVWLGGALMCGAIAWMLQAWVRPRWALIGGLFAVMQLGLSSYWTQSYWGGALAASGGALLFGGVPRILERPRARDGFLLGTGLVLLAFTRPYEGLVSALPAAGLFLAWAVGWRRAEPRGGWRRAEPRRRAGVVAAIAAALLPAALWLGSYHRAISGDPLRFPYQVHREQYEVASPFLWEEPAPEPVYRHPVLRDFWAGEMLEQYEEQRSVAGFLEGAWLKGKLLAVFYLGPFAGVVLLFLPWRRCWRARRFVLLTLALVLAAILAGTFRMAHYAAPVTALVVLLVTDSMRALCALRRGSEPLGRAWTAGVLAGTLSSAVLVAVRGIPGPPWFEERAGIQRQLERDGRHLVLVRYSPDHSPHLEWVFNGADLEGAAVLWARDLGPEKNARLLEHHPDRKVWLLEVTRRDSRYGLEPYAAD